MKWAMKSAALVLARSNGAVSENAIAATIVEKMKPLMTMNVNTKNIKPG